MRKILSLLFLLFPLALSAQRADLDSLQRWLNGIGQYDYNYPREKVYLHTDQQAYIKDETIWYKAYVMRASTLKPEPLSRVLYVDFLTADGQILDHQVLSISAQGQAEGYVELKDPIQAGFYELRAYTRMMLNWGREALYSQVIPVFSEEMEIDYPELKKPKPTHDAAPAPLEAVEHEEGYNLILHTPVDSTQLCALLYISNEQAYHVDTLTLGAQHASRPIAISYAALRDGWTRACILTTKGRSLGDTWLWKDPTRTRNLQVFVRQNKETYDAFAPIAVEVEVRYPNGEPARNVQFSMAVHDHDGDFLRKRPANMEAEFLKSRGGSSASVEQMIGARPFDVQYPIEDKFLMYGTLLKDNEKHTPMPNHNLSVSFYNLEQGGSKAAETTTNEDGYFAFSCEEDFFGDWIAHFNVHNENDKKRWGRVTLNRWLNAPTRQWKPRDLVIEARGELEDDTIVTPSLFAWKDTVRTILLKEAKVVEKVHKYKGLRGNRYTYKGGERRGKHFADYYLDVPTALEQWKDQGNGSELLPDFLQKYNPDFTCFPPEDDSEVEVSRYKYLYQGIPCYVVFDNKLVENGDGMSELQDVYWAEEVKSVVVMKDWGDYHRFIDVKPYPPAYALFVYTRPNHYRYRSKKGIITRVVQGYQIPESFSSPRYNGYDEVSDEDDRRTLYWAPTLTTNDEGKAHAVFFNNARSGTKLSFSLRGITPGGFLINVER